MKNTTCRFYSVALLALATLTAFVFGQDAPPAPPSVSSPAATQAIDQHEKSLADAQQAYFKTLTDADKQEVEALGAAMNAAMTAHDLDEANRIRNAKAVAEDALKQHALDWVNAIPGGTVQPAREPPVWTRTFEISALKWQPTVQVLKGQHFRITATGTWHHTPNVNETPDGLPAGPAQGVRDENGYAYYLEGRVDGGLPFGVGSSFEFVAVRNGLLELEMEDDAHYDNSGSLQVKVELLGMMNQKSH